MLCNSCLRRPACVTNKLASRDRHLKSMLQNLKHCELRISRPMTAKRRLARLLNLLQRR